MKGAGVQSNRRIVRATPLLSAIFLVAFFFAEGLSGAGRGEPAVTSEGSGRKEQALVESIAGQQILLKDLLGTPVMVADGETVGKVEDLILTQDGSPMAVIVAIGGLWGVGGKAVAVPWSRLVSYAHDEQMEILALDLKREALEAAPPFSRPLQPQGRTRLRMQATPQAH